MLCCQGGQELWKPQKTKETNSSEAETQGRPAPSRRLCTALRLGRPRAAPHRRADRALPCSWGSFTQVTLAVGSLGLGYLLPWGMLHPAFCPVYSSFSHSLVPLSLGISGTGRNWVLRHS